MIPTLTDPMGVSFAGRRLQYLESTGTQYIDTGVAPDFAGGDSIEISYFRADYTGSMPCVCGSRETTLRNGFHLLANNFAVYGSNSYKTYGVNEGFPVTQANCTIAVNDNYVVINGTQRISMPYRVTCSLAMTLFALRSGSSILVYYSGMKLYDWKYYRNGVLAQHLVPVLDSNDVPCMYDTVSNTFKYNAGTGVFNYAPHTPAKKLQYLESTGTQYIDTGVKPDYANGDSVEISFYRAEPNNTQAVIFGSRTSQVRNGFYIVSDKRTELPPFIYIACYSTGFVQIQMFLSHYYEDVKMTVENGNITTVSEHYNGTYTFTQQVTSEYSVYLFALNSGGSMGFSYPGMKLYDWKYWRNGVLAQHLVPVLDRSGVPCLYDTVTRTLVYNAGTGTFNYA